jgi:hypothetical protein
MESDLARASTLTLTGSPAEVVDQINARFNPRCRLRARLSVRGVRAYQQRTEPYRGSFLVPLTARHGEHRVLGLVGTGVGTPGPPIHLDEQSQGHPGRSFVPIALSNERARLKRITGELMAPSLSRRYTTPDSRSRCRSSGVTPTRPHQISSLCAPRRGAPVGAGVGRPTNRGKGAC